jgi:hypothetical protein
VSVVIPHCAPTITCQGRSPAPQEWRGARLRELSNHSAAKPMQAARPLIPAATRSPHAMQGVLPSSVWSEAPCPHRSHVGSWSIWNAWRRWISRERLMRDLAASGMPAGGLDPGTFGSRRDGENGAAQPRATECDLRWVLDYVICRMTSPRRRRIPPVFPPGCPSHASPSPPSQSAPPAAADACDSEQGTAPCHAQATLVVCAPPPRAGRRVVWRKCSVPDSSRDDPTVVRAGRD